MGKPSSDGRRPVKSFNTRHPTRHNSTDENDGPYQIIENLAHVCLLRCRIYNCGAHDRRLCPLDKKKSALTYRVNFGFDLVDTYQSYTRFDFPAESSECDQQ